MLRRLRKQLTVLAVIGSFFVAMFGLIVLIVYEPPPPPPPPPPTYQPLAVLSTGFFRAGPESADLYAIVRNPNANAGVRRVEYTFEARAGGAVIASQPGETFFMPGQEKPIVVIHAPVGGEMTDVALRFSSPEWVAVGPDFRVPSLIRVGERRLIREGPPALFEVKGVLANESGLDYLLVDVTAVGLGASGKILGVGRTFVGSLLSRERREYTVSWPLPAGAIISEVRVYPEVNVFSPKAVEPPRRAPGVEVP